MSPAVCNQAAGGHWAWHHSSPLPLQPEPCAPALWSGRHVPRQTVKPLFPLRPSRFLFVSRCYQFPSFHLVPSLQKIIYPDSCMGTVNKDGITKVPQCLPFCSDYAWTPKASHVRSQVPLPAVNTPPVPSQDSPWDVTPDRASRHTLQ